jgi:hypothetical protein
VGKTALALHWAHQIADRFGDGQQYVNLRGFEPSGTPVASEAAIRGFLEALSVPRERILRLPDPQAALYRSLAANLPGLDISVRAAASLAATDVHEARWLCANSLAPT